MKKRWMSDRTPRALLRPFCRKTAAIWMRILHRSCRLRQAAGNGAGVFHVSAGVSLFAERGVVLPGVLRAVLRDGRVVLPGHAARGRELVLARLPGGDGACRDVWRKPRLGRLYAAVYPCVCGLLCPLPLGKASGRESGHLLPLDALFGLIVFPFKHLFLRIRTVSFALTHRKTGEDKHPAAWAAMAVGALLALGLLALAVRELSGADAAFDAWTQKLLGVFQWRLNEQTLWNVLLSLPVGAYLFGLIAGTGREKIEAVRARGERVNAALGSLRKVPVAVWTAALGVFAALYLAFFSLQAGYLFGAFVKMIPDGYTIAEYARQGFFSLCRVMAVNFALLWLVTRACVKPVRQEKDASASVRGAAVPESGVCCHRGVQAVSVHQQLRLHTPAVAVCVADCRTRCGDWLRALFARDRKESGPVLDAVFRRDADAAELVLSRSRPKNIFEIPLTEPAVYAIITKINRASISRDRAVR